jgi:transcription-repair coupling factor (superfamily II helicase)
MLGFVRNQADVLVATTIIESGLDIPNVNTIFIDEADIYGLADLHQLRGRVGRYKHRAYAYLILDPSKALTPNAVRRLKAIEEFTELGAGFKIALRDLEIRGAGNILGAEQSGHIEAVGYELYCSLLEGAVRSLTGKKAAPKSDASIELSWRAYFPDDYVPGQKLKVELYRRLGRIRGLDRLADFRQELIDRFGPMPMAAEHLLVESELRVLSQRWNLARIHVEDTYAVLTYRDAKRIELLAKRHPNLVRIVDERAAYVPLGDVRPPVPEIAEVVRSLLAEPRKKVALDQSVIVPTSPPPHESVQVPMRHGIRRKAAKPQGEGNKLGRE